jgi:chorismate mutase
VLIALVVSDCARNAPFPTGDGNAVDHLIQSIQDRLVVANEVARTKWNTHAPIEDLPREHQIIDQVASRASDYGLDHDIAASFFRGQIEASKIVQRALHAEWKARQQAPFTTVLDLNEDIRPVLDRLTPEMMRALAAALPVLRRPGGRRLLERRRLVILVQTHLDSKAVREAIAPLLVLSR